MVTGHRVPQAPLVPQGSSRVARQGREPQDSKAHLGHKLQCSRLGQGNVHKLVVESAAILVNVSLMLKHSYA